MTTPDDAATAQLRDELGVVAFDLAALLGTDVLELATQRIADRASALIAELRDGTLADETARDIMIALWPRRAEPELGWWGSALGLTLAPFEAAHMDPELSWSRAETSVVLGVSPGTVAQLVARGNIGQAPGGGCSRVSVLTRLVRLAREG